jgi:hypothetical protein
MTTATCPRCGQRFDCGAAAPAPCGCSTLQLDPGLLARLRARWSGCLCLPCLRALARGAPLEPAVRPACCG